VIQFKEGEVDAKSTTPPETSTTPSEASSKSTASSNPLDSEAVVTPEASTSASVPELSTGAKAGIGVGASVGGLALVAVGAWLLLLRRRNASKTSSPSTIAASNFDSPREPMNRY